MKKDIFINSQPDECRIAVVSDGKLSELWTERASAASSVGNIYKGRVTNVEPSIQAAFVDFGRIKNGFLHISDVHPQYFPGGQKEHVEAVGKKRARRDRPPIQACLRRGQEVIVQVTKEGIGTKGATLTTYISIPGRYLVLMPGMHRLGVSRKIEDEDQRSQARQILEELKPPPEVGFIVRTAGMDQSKRELQRDLNYLVRLWKSVEGRSRESRAPAELYQESDLVIRTIRDIYSAEVGRIVCDRLDVAHKVKDFLHLTMPRTEHKVELYEGTVGLFHAFGLEEEIERIGLARVPLPSGGSLVIDQAEALVAIDVNSGRFRDTENAEAMAVRINSEAAREVARQLRLRDLGGVIIIDFIDMVEEKNRRQIERILRDEIKEDRARTKLLRISRFGIIEMTRQRVRPSLQSSIFRPCPHCAGIGRIKSDESQALSAMRTIRLAANAEGIARIELTVSPNVADHLLNLRREELGQLETACGTKILVHGDRELPAGQCRVVCTDGRGTVVQWEPVEAAKALRPEQTVTRAISADELAEYRRRSGQPEEPDLAEIELAAEGLETSVAAAPTAPAEGPGATAASPTPPAPAAGVPAGAGAPGGTGKRRGRRRRRRRGGGGGAAGAAPSGGPAVTEAVPAAVASGTAAPGPAAPVAEAVSATAHEASPAVAMPAPVPSPSAEPAPQAASAEEAPVSSPAEPAAAAEPSTAPAAGPGEAAPKRPRRRRRSRRSNGGSAASGAATGPAPAQSAAPAEVPPPPSPATAAAPTAEGGGPRKPRRRRRRRKPAGPGGPAAPPPAEGGTE